MILDGFFFTSRAVVLLIFNVPYLLPLLLTSHFSLLTPYSLLLTPYSLLLTPYSLLLTPYSLLLSSYL
ncbi:hypothetical protein GC098_34070 [Paenibacillus sp. LMG 31458]|uniref:Uncharacterized protein n=1 Tax=Paenibacillus phytorum TaxID=2654977 RepID=A0ABX1Y8P7_9BACL|nr:hypothetical protein [Paenibacillus phytorum]